MNRKEILAKAEEYICKDRNTSYGEPENNFQNIANLWNAHILAKYKAFPTLQAVDVGIMMTLLKVARMASGNKEDNYIDAAGYIACAGEIATEEADRKLKADASKRVLDSLHEMANKDKKPAEQTTTRNTRPIILDGVVCMYETPSKDEMDKFWHDVLTSNGDID